MIRAISAALLAFACLNVITAAPAHARKHHHHNVTRHVGANHVAWDHAPRMSRRAMRNYGMTRDVQTAGMSGATVVGGRPSGCPRQYCGCGTSLKIFGRIRPELNLAANWVRKFPRTAPAPGMAAARSGHVMLLMEHVGGDKWKVYDSNSGGGLTRVHVRSIRGFAVVNPHATTVAQS